MINLEELRRDGENSFNPELDRRTSIGVVLMVVAKSQVEADPLVWTLIELTGKPQTDKIPGQISLPAETRKVDEGEVDTLLGALGEFSDSDAVIDHLFVDPDRFYARNPVSVKGKPVDVAFLLYDGALDEPNNPVDPSETAPNGWMPVSMISRLNGEVRSVAHDSLDFAVSQGIFSSIRTTDKESLIPLSALVEPEFSLRQFIEVRETKPDIDLSKEDPEEKERRVVANIVANSERYFSEKGGIQPREFGSREGQCTRFAMTVRAEASMLGVSASIYQVYEIQAKFGGQEAGMKGFSHEFNVVRMGDNSYLVDLTVGQFVDPDSGQVSHKEEGFISGAIEDYSILGELVRKGFIKLNDENLRRYLRATSGVSDKSYIDLVTTEQLLDDPMLLFTNKIHSI